MAEFEHIEKELRTIQERNLRVEADKAWETSYARLILIAAITYIVAAAVLYFIEAPDYWKGACVPVVGYLLSTLSVPWMRDRWIKRYMRRRT